MNNIFDKTDVPLYSIYARPRWYKGEYAGNEIDKNAWRVALVTPRLP